MKITTDTRKRVIQRGMTTPQVLLLVATVLVILFFGYRQFARHFSSEMVIVAKADLTRGQEITNNQVKQKRLPRNQVPEDAIRRIVDVLGQRIQSDVESSAVLRARNFEVAQAVSTDLKELIPEGRVLYGLNMTNQTLPLFGVMGGDSLDIIVAGPSTENNQTRIANVLARDVQMVGYTVEGGTADATNGGSNRLGINVPPPPSGDDDDPPKTLLMIAVRPDDVVRLAAADGAGLHLAVVLHRKTEEGSERLRVNNRERIQVIRGNASESIALP